MSTERL